MGSLGAVCFLFSALALWPREAKNDPRELRDQIPPDSRVFGARSHKALKILGPDPARL